MTETTAQEHERLREAVTRARVILWDFDGPVCRLFAGHKPESIARHLVDWLADRGPAGLLDERERLTEDPQDVLRAVDRRRPGSELVAELEERLTEEELRASATAAPTEYADRLIRTWTATGSRLAITSNNSPQVVRAYLDGRGLTGCFAPHIYGRTGDVRRLKPDPHCLNRALDAMGAAPAVALMIGDSLMDLTAAHTAGVEFLGYARDEEKRALLHESGADHVVTSLEPLLRMLGR
ncbi:HAD family hydrolase [Streptomyces sp. NPDC086787]|uniref:HAD family hydrolase n=1 Tax=Streptomyces sp. NPDC086787 TaxID=3365759 RepID=UPI0038047A9A